jgi:hypothetical protein
MTYQIREITNPHQNLRLRPHVKAVACAQPTGESTQGHGKSLADEIWTLMQLDLYGPELYYMRGAGPKSHAKHELAVASLDDAIGGLRNDREYYAPRPQSAVLQTFRKWPNTAFAVICATAILCILLPLSIATSLISFSSSPVSAEPPGQMCVAVSEGEYQGARRKNLPLTKFGTYERTGRLGRYSYWYCH